MQRAPDPMEAASTFYASMPERYRAAFGPQEVREHAAIASRRGQVAVHVELWRRLPDGAAVMCIVADDRAGLLSFISASVIAHRLDVVAAQAYTRVDPRTGRAEAVDFLWVRRDAALALPVLPADVAPVQAMLTALVTGESTIDEIVRRARPSRPAPPGAATRVSFDQSRDASLVVLAVETFDRPGLLLVITRALFRAGVQIIACDATTRNRRVVDRFTIVEQDGAPIRPPRRGVVQMEVLAAIEALACGGLE